jgi:hypothetical protein
MSNNFVDDDDFGMNENNNNNNNNNNVNYDNQQPPDDFFSQNNEVPHNDYDNNNNNNNKNQNNDDNDMDFNNDNSNNNNKYQQEKYQEDLKSSEPTALQLWEEERKKILSDRANKEREEQSSNIERGKKELIKWKQDRDIKIKSKQEENRRKEKDLRQDIQSTFEHGTIWEQVAKMANLQDKKPSKFTSNNSDDGYDRMRNLLIHLKNVKK